MAGALKDCLLGIIKMCPLYRDTVGNYGIGTAFSFSDWEMSITGSINRHSHEPQALWNQYEVSVVRKTRVYIYTSITYVQSCSNLILVHPVSFCAAVHNCHDRVG